jgi:hypothetical protein
MRTLFLALLVLPTLALADAVVVPKADLPVPPPADITVVDVVVRDREGYDLATATLNTSEDKDAVFFIQDISEPRLSLRLVFETPVNLRRDDDTLAVFKYSVEAYSELLGRLPTTNGLSDIRDYTVRQGFRPVKEGEDRHDFDWVTLDLTTRQIKAVDVPANVFTCVGAVDEAGRETGLTCEIEAPDAIAGIR